MQGPRSRRARLETGAPGSSRKAQGGGEKTGVKASSLPLGSETQRVLQRCRGLRGVLHRTVQRLARKSCRFVAVRLRVAVGTERGCVATSLPSWGFACSAALFRLLGPLRFLHLFLQVSRSLTKFPLLHFQRALKMY